MTPQELKSSILQLAIQGKLVEQRPEEGTGEELYRQIQAEKQRLIKDGTIKKEKPLPKIAEDEKPFEIPENWMWVRVGTVTILNPKNTLNDEMKTAFVPMTCVADGYRNEHTFEVKKWGEIKKGFTHFADGDIGIAKITPCFQNRKSVVFNGLENGFGAGTTELSIVRTLEDTIDRQYLLWFVKTDYFISNGVKSFTGTAGQQRIHKDYLANCPVPLPPLAEQKRIVAKIEELLPYIDRYEQAWSKLENFNKRFPVDMQKSILQTAIQGKLVEQRPEEGTGEELYRQIQAEKQRLIKAGTIKKEKPLPEIAEDEKLFDIPDSWKWVRLSDICNISDGTHQTPTYVEKGMPFISAQNVKPYRFIPSNYRFVSEADFRMYNKNLSPQKGDILMTRVGAGIGEAAIIDIELQFAIYVSLTLIKCYKADYDMNYLLQVLNSPIGHQLAKKKTLGKGASQGNLNLIFIRNFVLPLPPLAEQKRIVAKLEEILPLCERLK